MPALVAIKGGPVIGPAGQPPTDRAVVLAGLSARQRAQAMSRWHVLRPHVEDSVPLVRVAAGSQVAERTLRWWLAAWRAGGLAALARQPARTREPGGCLLTCRSAPASWTTTPPPTSPADTPGLTVPDQRLVDAA